MQGILRKYYLNFDKWLIRFVDGNINMLKFTEYLTVIFAACLKFAGGIFTGMAFGLSPNEVAICTAIGMVIAVISIIFGNHFLEKILDRFKVNKKKKKFSRLKRFAVRVKQILGLWGIAFLTPILFMPVGGTLIALSFKYSKWKILLLMTLSAIVCSPIMTHFLFFFKNLFL